MVVLININPVIGIATPTKPGPSVLIPSDKKPLITQGENETAEAMNRDLFHLIDIGVVQNWDSMYGTTNIRSGPQAIKK